MSINNTDQALFLDNLVKHPVIPVFNHSDTDIAANVLHISYEAGIRVFEFTNRNSEALNVFAHLQQEQKSLKNFWFGAGTVINAEEAEAFIERGAQFIVSPIMDTEMAEVCKVHGVPWIPGCGSLTEIITATRAGSQLQKIFPGSVLGPGFIKAVRGPCPYLKLMPTGGVKATEENLQKWFEAGAYAVGMGSALFPSHLVDKKNWKDLSKHIRQVITIAKKLRKL